MQSGPFGVSGYGCQFGSQGLEVSPGGGFSQGLEGKECVFLAWQVMVIIAPGAVVWLPGIYFGAVSTYDDQGVKIQGGAFDAIRQVIAIGEQRIFNTFIVFAIGCEREYIGGIFQKQPGGVVEDLFAEVEYQGGENKLNPPQIRLDRKSVV